MKDCGEANGIFLGDGRGPGARPPRAWVATAAPIRFHGDRNRQLRALGNDREPQPALAAAPLRLAPGDAFLPAHHGSAGRRLRYDCGIGINPQRGAPPWQPPPYDMKSMNCART